MADAERVSVVVPTRDRAQTVVRAVTSVLAQEQVELEVIAVDDGSRDDSALVLAGLGEPRLRVLRNERSVGVAGARNRGIGAARMPWIAFLDDDDVWAPDKLRRQLQQIAAERADFCYCGVATVDEAGTLLELRTPPQPQALRDGIRRYNQVYAGGSTMVVSRDLLESVGGFDERLHHLADWDLWIRLTEAGRPAACAEPLVAYVVHPGSMHLAAIDTAAVEVRHLRAKHAASRLPGEVDDLAFRRWLAIGRADAGHPLAAAGTFASAFVRHRRPGDARSALGSLARALGLRDGRRSTPPGPAPQWLIGFEREARQPQGKAIR
jgi:glycosyltransferase involved in cell wall biosynthesis